MVLIFIFALITVTFYQVFSIGTRYIIDSKNRLGAISLANERMEMARNLSYNDIGTQGGQIEGNIPQEQDVTENGRIYHVKTEVSYVQDLLDGLAGSGDINWEDYKKVTIIVSWNNQSFSSNVTLTSRFVPPGLEVNNPNDGILSINVFSDQPGGTGIPNSSVHVANSETGLSTTLETDSSGNVTLMGNNITQSIQKYEITVSKSGYETISTMPPFPITSYMPTNVHASVVLGSVNVANIVQNELTNLKIRSENGLGEAVSNVDLNLTGGRVLGTGATYPYQSVYTIDGSYSTDSSGEKDWNDIGPGQFVISPTVPSGYELINIDPGENFSLYSSADLTVKIRLAPINVTSLLVTVQANNDGTLEPVSGAEVKLSNTTTGGSYDKTVISASNGNAYFPVSSDIFVPGDYELKIKATGYSENTSTVTIRQDELVKNSVTLSL